MPPIAQRLREPAAFVLLAFGALSTLFHSITFLFGPGESSGLGGGPSFSDRAGVEVATLLSVEVTAALVGAVWLAHVQSHLKLAKVITLSALISFGVMDLFGVVALFSSFGSNQAGLFDANGAIFGSGWGKTQTFFIALGELAVAGIGTWLVLGYFQHHHQPAKPAAGFQQQQQWGPGPQQPQQQWQQQPPQQQAPQGQPWGPPPQQQQPPQQVPQQQPPQPQWGQPQQQDADSMMTQAIPTVPPAPQGQQQQQPPQQPPQQDGGLPIGNWTAE